jgi:hypothetical protein
MSFMQRRVLVVLIGVACLSPACVKNQTTGGTPVAAATPTPIPPVVIKEGALGIPTAASVRGASFKLDRSGTVQVGLDWTATGDETTLFVRLLERSFEGPCAPGCEREELCPSSCHKEVEAWGGKELAKAPATLKTSSVVQAGNYELHVSYYDPLDYLIPFQFPTPARVTVSYQIVLMPAAMGAARSRLE